MQKMSHVKQSIITAICIALCVVLPAFFHAFPQGGPIYLPMHIPVLLCGLICMWPYGLLCGILGPLLSSLITGMPTLPGIPGSIIEMSIYGVVASLMMMAVHTKNTYADLYISLITAMMAGRVAAGIVNALIFARGTFSFATWGITYFATGVPGIIIQLIIIPSIVYALMKARLIPMRYKPKKSAPELQEQEEDTTGTGAGKPAKNTKKFI